MLQRAVLAFAASLVAVCVPACGSGNERAATPMAPPPSPSFVAVTVGIAGNLPPVLAPGATLQLWATAQSTDGTTMDVTNAVLWQSSDPAVATVSPAGLLRAAIEGSVTVSALYQKITGTLKAEIRKSPCRATTTPERLVYNAFGGSGQVAVTLTASDCRWTANSTASWLALTSTPTVSGTGTVHFSVNGNNTPQSRSARIVIAADGAETASLEIEQDKPVSCSYVVDPAQRRFASTGGTGAFDVITTPADCQWRVDAFEGSVLLITSARSGMGRGTVTYSIGPNQSTSFELSTQISIRGLSGANPPGIHTIVVNTR